MTIALNFSLFIMHWFMLMVSITVVSSTMNMKKDERITVSDFYPSGKLSDGNGEIDFQIYLNEDIETYLRDLADVDATTPKAVGIQTTGGDVSNRILNSFLAYCQKHGIRALRYYERLEEDIAHEAELIRIAQEDIGIEGFKEFRTIPFYKNPDLDKEVVEISQGQIIREIIRQAENAYDDAKGKDNSGISLSQHQQALESRSCSRFRRFILLKNIIN